MALSSKMRALALEKKKRLKINKIKINKIKSEKIGQSGGASR